MIYNDKQKTIELFVSEFFENYYIF